MTKANPYVYAGNDPISEVDPSGAGNCLGSIGWNGLFGGLSAYFLLQTIIPAVATWTTSILTLDAASASIGAALGASLGAAFGPFVLAGIAVLALAGAAYGLNMIVQDCKS